MGNGLTLDGTGDFVWHQAEAQFHSADWSFEAWIKPADIGDSSTSMPILFIGDGDDVGTIDEGDDELQIGIRNGYLELCYDSCSGIPSKKYFNSETQMETGKWYHIAVSYDTDGNGLQPGYNAFINGKLVSDGDDETAGNQHDASDFKTVISSNYPETREYYLGAGELSGGSAIANFNGVIDEARWAKYEKNAFAAGIMISQVVPSTNKVTIYNIPA